MDARFYIHVYNELDLAGRTTIEAFDRERRARMTVGRSRAGTGTGTGVDV